MNIPEGWKLVPIEPTKEMLDAARWNDGVDTARQVWAEMVAASPVAPEQCREPITWLMRSRGRLYFGEAGAPGHFPVYEEK